MKAIFRVGALVVLSCSPAKSPNGDGDPLSDNPVPGSGGAAPAEGGPSVSCGGAKCRAGTEVCCDFGDKSVCGTMGGKKPAPGEEINFWFEQSTRCAAAGKGEYSLTSMSACDDSRDCANDEMCCGSAMSDITLEVCAPFEEGTTACEYGELCAGTESCRTAGTRCIEGRCRKGPVRSCGGKACTDDAPICCAPFGSTAAECGTAASCKAKEHTAEYACATPADCPKGEHCIASLGGTRCQAAFDVANNGVVCSKHEDCPAEMCTLLASSSTRPRCTGSTPGPGGDIKACECP